MNNRYDLGGWTTYTTSTSSNTTPYIVLNGPSTVSIAPDKPAPLKLPKPPLEWLRDEVDEICRLAAA